MRLSTFSEPQILELVSACKLSEIFPFRAPKAARKFHRILSQKTTWLKLLHCL